MSSAARQGDLTQHGGVITSGCATVLIEGKPAARMGDAHVCPMLNPGVPPPPHVGGALLGGCPSVLIGGLPAARVGDAAICIGPPDTIATGAASVIIGGSAPSPNVADQLAIRHTLVTAALHQATRVADSTPRPAFDLSLVVPLQQTLIPLHPDAADPAGRWGGSTLRVEVGLLSESHDFRAAGLELGFYARGHLLHCLKDNECHKALTVGRHELSWDGYQKGRLDTTLLQSIDEVRLKVQGPDGQVKEKAVKDIQNQAKARWVSANIDLPGKVVTLEVYCYYQNPQGLPTIEFERLKSLANDGIQRYWSRNISLNDLAGNTETFQIKVVAQHRERRDAEGRMQALGVEIKKETGPEYRRSHNTDIVDATFYCSEGYWVAEALRMHNSKHVGRNNAMTEFMMVAAHEFGHTVLSSFHGRKYSWEHHNTSRFWGALNPSTPGFPLLGNPIDLMKYYDPYQHDLKLADKALYTQANETDVRTLIWVTQLAFNILPENPAGD